MPNIFEKMCGMIEGLIYFCLLLAGAACVVFVLYFVSLSVWRTLQLCWDQLFSHRWGW